MDSSSRDICCFFPVLDNLSVLYDSTTVQAGIPLNVSVFVVFGVDFFFVGDFDDAFVFFGDAGDFDEVFDFVGEALLVLYEGDDFLVGVVGIVLASFTLFL